MMNCMYKTKQVMTHKSRLLSISMWILKQKCNQCNHRFNIRTQQEKDRLHTYVHIIYSIYIYKTSTTTKPVKTVMVNIFFMISPIKILEMLM